VLSGRHAKIYSCALTANHGSQIGWEPQYKAEHALEAADKEVSLILKNI
jgi:hypothetical protein